MNMKAVKYRKLPDIWLLVTTLICFLIGFWFGSSVGRNHELLKISLYSHSGSSSSSSTENFSTRNLSKIYIASSPCRGGLLPQKLVKTDLDFSLHVGLGNETVKKPKYLLALPVGIQQKVTVNKIVSKFSEEFAIILFHYDGRTSEWDEFEWSERAIHISALKQTKWWYAKRFLHPDVVEQYEYIFMWDEDLGVDHFNGQEYIKLVKKYNLEISQPAITSKAKPTWKMTRRRNDVEVHKEAGEQPSKCGHPHLPPCAGFVEIMAPVFSKKSWNCVWQMIQNDLVHGWGLDFAFWKCVEKPHEDIGVVDAQWIQHLVFPTLKDQGNSTDRASPRIKVRARSFAEWKEFERRLKEAEKQRSGNGSSTDKFSVKEFSDEARKKYELYIGKLGNSSESG